MQKALYVPFDELGRTLATLACSAPAAQGKLDTWLRDEQLALEVILELTETTGLTREILMQLVPPGYRLTKTEFAVELNARRETRYGIELGLDFGAPHLQRNLFTQRRTTGHHADLQIEFSVDVHQQSTLTTEHASAAQRS